MADGTVTDYKTHVLPRLTQSVVESLRQYLDYRPYLTRGLADFSSGRIFLVGGNDITPTVARQIFARYNVPEELKNGFMWLIQSYATYVPMPDLPQQDVPGPGKQ